MVLPWLKSQEFRYSTLSVPYLIVGKKLLNYQKNLIINVSRLWIRIFLKHRTRSLKLIQFFHKT